MVEDKGMDSLWMDELQMDATSRKVDTVQFYGSSSYSDVFVLMCKTVDVRKNVLVYSFDIDLFMSS